MCRNSRLQSLSTKNWDIAGTVKTIERVVAVHFLPLVFKEQLELSIFDGEEHIRTVNRDRLHDILFQYKDQRRRRSISRLDRMVDNPGQRWMRMNVEKPTFLSTSLGNISVH